MRVHALPHPHRAPLACLALVLALVVGLAAPWPAQAAARVGISSPLGAGLASSAGPTTLTVSGSGFQSVPNAMGGIYVMFGTVTNPSSGNWRPSQGGAAGSTYFYVPDSESASNHGYQRYVAFPGSSTSSEANGGQLAADGSWSTQLVIPGPTFTAIDRSGASQQIDCRSVRCGIITIGAHGIKNANNETFTPLTFTGGSSSGSAGAGASQGGAQAGAGGAGPDRGDAGAPASTGSDSDADSAAVTDEARTTAAPGSVLVGVDSATAVVGRAMSFSARGFEPGEQVSATLDDGVVAVGPLLAGAQGEVAGILELPVDLRVGTHVLRVTGAASERVAETEVVLSADPVLAAQAAPPTVTSQGWDPAWVAVAGAGAVLLTLLGLGLVGRFRRRSRSDVPAEAAPEGELA